MTQTTSNMDLRGAVCGVWFDSYKWSTKTFKTKAASRDQTPYTPVEYFQRKRDGLQLQKKTIVSITSQSKCALKASYLVAWHVARSKKAFRISEELVLPAAVDMCREMVGEAAAKKNAQGTAVQW